MVPGVASTAMAQSTPMNGGLAIAVDVPGYTWGSDGYSAPFVNAVDPKFVEVMGMRVIDGRGFSDADNRPGAASVAIVNESMARRFWPGASAVGRCLLIEGGPCTQVIGVVAKAPAIASLRSELSAVAAQYFVPSETFRERSLSRVVLVRTTGNPRALLRRLRDEAQAARADLPYVEAFPLDELVDGQVKPLRLGWWIFIGLSGLAVTIAVTGLAVVSAHGVARRTRELGIRLALGAKPSELVRMMTRRTLVALTVGVAIGGSLAYVSGVFLKDVLFEIEPGEPRVFASVVVVLLAAGSIAAWVPARRTSRIDPSSSLRIE